MMSEGKYMCRDLEKAMKKMPKPFKVFEKALELNDAEFLVLLNLMTIDLEKRTFNKNEMECERING